MIQNIKKENKIYDFVPISIKQDGNISLIYDYYKNKYIDFIMTNDFIKYFPSSINNIFGSFSYNFFLNTKYEERKTELSLVKFQLFVSLFFLLFLIINFFSNRRCVKLNSILFGGCITFILLLNYCRGILLLVLFFCFLFILQIIVAILFLYRILPQCPFSFIELIAYRLSFFQVDISLERLMIQQTPYKILSSFLVPSLIIIWNLFFSATFFKTKQLDWIFLTSIVIIFSMSSITKIIVSILRTDPRNIRYMILNMTLNDIERIHIDIVVSFFIICLAGSYLGYFFLQEFSYFCSIYRNQQDMKTINEKSSSI